MRIKVSLLLAAFAVASLFLVGVGEEIEFPSISIKTSKESNEGEGRRVEGREVDDRYFVEEKGEPSHGLGECFSPHGCMGCVLEYQPCKVL